MFHSSESIIITSDKTKSKSSILANSLRQRASTWSASSEGDAKDGTSSNTKLRSKLTKAVGKPFHKRQQSSSSQNSNSRLSIHSLDDYNRHSQSSANNNNNNNAATATGSSVTSAFSSTGRQSKSSHNTPVSQSQSAATRWAFPLGMPMTPNSHDARSSADVYSLGMTASPPDVVGVSREGLDQWLGDNYSSPTLHHTGNGNGITNGTRFFRSTGAMSPEQDYDGVISTNSNTITNASTNSNAKRSNLSLVRSADDISRLSIPSVYVSSGSGTIGIVASASGTGTVGGDGQHSETSASESQSNAGGDAGGMITASPSDPYDSITPRASGNTFFHGLNLPNVSLPPPELFKLSRPLSMRSAGGSESSTADLADVHDVLLQEHQQQHQHQEEVESSEDASNDHKHGGMKLPQDREAMNHPNTNNNNMIIINNNNHEYHDGENIFPPNINIASGPAHLHFQRGYSIATDESTLNDDYDDVSRSSVPQSSQDTFDTPTSRSSCVRFMDELELTQNGPTPASYKRRPPASLVMDDLEHHHIDVQRGGLGYCTPDGFGLDVRDRDRDRDQHDDIEDPHDALIMSQMNHLQQQQHSSQVEMTQLNHQQQNHHGSNDSDGVTMQNRDSHLRSSSSSLRRNKSDGDSTGSQMQGDGFFIQKFYRYCWCFPQAPKPSWSRVSSAVVRNAPCFWCCFRQSRTGGTDRDTLIKLNFLCAIIGLWQFSVGIFIVVIFLSDDIVDRNHKEDVPYRQHYKEALSPNLWMVGSILLALSIVGFILFVTAIFTIPVIRRVNLVGAIKYMWVLYWVAPVQIFLVIALFDYHNVTEVWIKHWWGSPSMAWFRLVFCETGTSNKECALPYKGGSEYQSAEAWCEAFHNSTRCENIREKAISKMEQQSYFVFYLNAIIGGGLVILLLLSLGLLENIISAPIVQRSKETNIPLWLTFPIAGCFLLGFALLFSPQSLLSNESGTNIYWIGVWCMISMATFSVSALLGWFISAKTVLNTRDKKQKEIAIYVFIVMMFFTIIAVGFIFTVSLGYSLDIVRVSLKESQRGAIACYVDSGNSCSNCMCTTLAELDTGCPSELPQCPEWTSQDVTRIVQTQLKQTATLAAIFFIYAFSALRFGLDLRRSQSKYQIAYV